MEAIIVVTTPFFVLVVVGYLASRHGLLQAPAAAGLNIFALYFGLPCLLFRLATNTPLLGLLNPSVVALYLLCGAMLVFFTIGVTARPRLKMKDAAFGAMAATVPNAGAMGVPLVVALLGESAVGALFCVMLADMFIITSLCIALSELDGMSRHDPWSAGLRALRKTFSNPLPWAIAMGTLFSLAGWRASGPVDALIRMLAEAASPVALLAFGAMLHQASHSAKARKHVRRAMPVAVIKLFVHPLLVLVLGMAARQIGVSIPTAQVLALTLVAALPSAITVWLLADRYGANSPRIAYAVLLSTALAFLTFTTLAWLVGARPRPA